MKKAITWVLLAAMLLSAVALAIPAGAEALYIQYETAGLFTTPPTIDGYISYEEWGRPNISITSASAATTSSKEPVDNTFFYWRPGYAAQEKTMSYDAWFGWDANYFYVGVKVRDLDGHSLKGGKTNTWNGDAMQIYVDYEGPNSVMFGDTFDPTFSEKPWAQPTLIPDFIIGYTQIAGGFIEMFENTRKIGMTAYNNPAKGAAKVAVAPAGMNYSADTNAGYTTYEVAIPWNYIFYNEDGVVTLDTTATVDESVWGGINRELGVSMVVFNGEPGTSGYSNYLAWGSGICGSQILEALATCGGSNSVMLTDEEITPEPGYTTYNPAQLENFARDFSGFDQGVYYDYLGGDIARQNPLTSKDQLTTLTFDNDSDLDIWGGAYQGMIVDSGDPEHGSVLDYTDMNVEQSYIDSTNEEEQYKFPLSYTMEFDIMYTGNEYYSEDSGINKYPPALFNWFGGSSGYEYEIGYYFNDGQFKIVTSETRDQAPLAAVNYKFEPNTWYNWRFVFDNKSCTARLYINDEAIFGEDFWNRYFYYSGDEHQKDGTLMLWRMFNTQFQMDNIRIYNAVGKKADANVGEGGNTNSGGNVSGGTSTATGSNDLDVSNVYKDENGLFRLPVYVTSLYKQATALSFEVTMDPAAGTLDSISGLNEGTYKVEDLGNGKYLITITDFAQVKAMNAGEVYFEILIKPASDAITAADLKLALKDTYKYTVATGDAMIYIALAAVVMGIGCVVVYKKRKSFVR